MPKPRIIKEGLLYDLKRGSVIDLGFGEDNKFFAVLVQSGHCGNGYFIPTIVTAWAKDAKAAGEYAKFKARTKTGSKDCIIATCEISYIEKFMIELIRMHDPYCSTKTHNSVNKPYEEIRRRRIVLPAICPTNPDETLIRLDGNIVEIKMAENYDDDCVLERYCAPSIKGEKITYPHKLNLQEILNEYYDINTIKYGIGKRNELLMALYYQHAGENNVAGIKYSHGMLEFPVGNGHTVKRTLSPQTRAHLDVFCEKQLAKQEELPAQSDPLYDYTPSRPSQIDKFKQRLANTERIVAEREQKK